VLECVPLAGVARHCFTTRDLAPSDPDQPGGAGWRELADDLGVRPDLLTRLRQVHGAAVHVADPRGGVTVAPLPAADIAVAADPALAVSVRVADCVPLLLADRRTGAVAAAHAGWRGTAARVAVEAVRALAKALGSRPQDLLAAVGPSIGPCCYQVGQEVLTAFEAAGHPARDLERWFAPDAAGRWRLDLWAATRDQLEGAGLRSDAVLLSGFCTASRTDRFFSYRVEGPRAGRLVAAIRPRLPSP